MQAFSFYLRFVSFLGILPLILCSFIDPEIMMIYQIRLQMSFGEPLSETEVYVFTSWNSQECSQMDIMMQKIAPSIVRNDKLFFVDILNAETEKLVSVNEKILLDPRKNLDDYLKIRKTLFQIAEKSVTLSEKEIKKAIESQGIVIEKFSSEVTDIGLQIFKDLRKNLKVAIAPTIVIYNLETRNWIKIEGLEEIKSTPILDKIESLKSKETLRFIDEFNEKFFKHLRGDFH